MKEKTKEYFEKTAPRYNIRVYNSEGEHLRTFEELQENEMFGIVAYETSCLDRQCLVERAAWRKKKRRAADD